MFRTYVCGDPKFCDEAAARQNRMSIEVYQKRIIEGINKRVDKGDFIVFTGDLGITDVDKVKELMSQINGGIYFLSESKEIEEEFKDVCMTIGADLGQKVKIMDKDSFLIYPVNNVPPVPKDKDNVYFAAAASQMKNGDSMYKDRILNISIDKLNFEPICMEDIVNMIDGYELFATMKTEERIY